METERALDDGHGEHVEEGLLLVVYCFVDKTNGVEVVVGLSVGLSMEGRHGRPAGEEEKTVARQTRPQLAPHTVALLQSLKGLLTCLFVCLFGDRLVHVAFVVDEGDDKRREGALTHAEGPFEELEPRPDLTLTELS